MGTTSKPQDSEIHTLIQAREFDFYGFIGEHREEIDDHVAHCHECREKMIGWSSHLPKLRARVTVAFPAPKSRHERIEQMQQLKRGQCLPCGCEVTDAPWTEEEARTAFNQTLARIMGVAENKMRRVPATTRLQDLPLCTKSLRRLRDAFWIPDGSSGSEKIRDAEEGDNVPDLPETVGDFVQAILSLHAGMSYTVCGEHWSP